MKFLKKYFSLLFSVLALIIIFLLPRDSTPVTWYGAVQLILLVAVVAIASWTAASTYYRRKGE